MSDQRTPPRPPLPTGLAAIGAEMTGFPLFGLVLDYAFGTMPWLTLAMAILGVLVAFLHLFRMRKPATPNPRSRP